MLVDAVAIAVLLALTLSAGDTRRRVAEHTSRGMREYLAAYRRLPYRGPVIERPDGTVAEPPVLIAALGPRLLELAATATDADGNQVAETQVTFKPEGDRVTE